MTLPLTAQQPESMSTLPPTTDAMAPESNHGSEATADALPPPPIVRLMIWPDGTKGFVSNNNVCTQETTNLHFRCDAEHDLTMKKIFDYRMGRRLQQMLDDIRQGRDHWTQWLRPDIKKALFVHWESDEGFRHRRLTN
ncbi:hypothetical protein Ahy_B05g078255 [Arachis hypogaea]|uniref:Uncharacterized protein n=1 Tax=Arachis hypogaea TaxID=3818 RepID=A0A444Z6N9_ARAHY|nr:hypothetical protein Ahy_B05g078255 [Arachis hypogaea]